MANPEKVLSDLIVSTKYSRYIPEQNRRERWEEVVDRNMQMHLEKFPELGYYIRHVYKYFVSTKKVLPSMRSLQFAGKAIKNNNTRIFNCAYLPIDDVKAFSEVMYLLLGGTGVGFSVQTLHVKKLPEILKNVKKEDRQTFVIEDSIEGWANAVAEVMNCYFTGLGRPVFDYSLIRPKGTPLTTAGGKAPGHEPLKKCLDTVCDYLDNIVKSRGTTKLKPIEVYDIICFLSEAVLAGGIRRSALICLFSPEDKEMMEAKSGEWWIKTPQRARSNNSAVHLRTELTKEDIKNLITLNKDFGSGEPGIWLTNNLEYGTNPCVEAALEPFQFCNLCEVNVSNIESQTDLNNRVRAAAFIGTLQASYTDFTYLRPIWKQTTEKDALLGIGLTGIGSGQIFNYDVKEAAEEAKKVNLEISKKININKSSRLTVIKPSGTSSLVLGTSSGIHSWHAPYYIRRIRLNKLESAYKYFKQVAPELIEDDKFAAETTAVLSLPQKAPEGSIFRNEPSINLLNRIKHFYENWIVPGHNYGDNKHSISATISVKPEEWDEIEKWLWENKEVYSGISMLPYDGGTYEQAPFEDIDEDTYIEMCKHLKYVDIKDIVETDDNRDLRDEAACVGGVCEII